MPVIIKASASLVPSNEFKRIAKRYFKRRIRSLMKSIGLMVNYYLYINFTYASPTLQPIAILIHLHPSLRAHKSVNDSNSKVFSLTSSHGFLLSTNRKSVPRQILLCLS